MSVSGISSNSGSSNDTTTGAAAGRETKLGQDAFMRLLTTQLANQDPLKPQDNGEFIAQLATFSSLEKLTTIATKLDQIGTALGVNLTTTQTAPTDTGGTSSPGGSAATGSTDDTATSSTSNGGK